MDLAAKFLARRKLIFPFITPEAIGRWFLYMFRGKFIHEDINTSPALQNEKFWCDVSHYLIGVVLAGIYLFLELKVPMIREQAWFSIVFGIATVILPWFWLLPSVGLGIMASKSQDRLRILRTNLTNHTNFGLGLFLWIVLFHRFFVQ